MDKNTLLLIAAAGLAYLAMTNQEKEHYFNVPGIGPVPESALPGLGYVKMNGQWYTAAAVNAAAIQAGGTPGQTITEGTAIFNTIMTILQTGFNLYTQITQITQANRAQAIQQILDKYTSLTSPDYIPMFQYTNQDLQGMTIGQLQTILDTGSL